MALQRPETHFNPQFSTHTAQLLAQPPFARNGKTHHLPQEADFPLVTSPVTPPTVKVPVRIKITLPYFVLALLVAMAGAYIVSRVVLDSIEDHFTNQLIEAGQLATDQMVREENRLLETWRLLAHMQSLAEAIVGGDTPAEPVTTAVMVMRTAVIIMMAIVTAVGGMPAAVIVTTVGTAIAVVRVTAAVVRTMAATMVKVFLIPDSSLALCFGSHRRISMIAI